MRAELKKISADDVDIATYIPADQNCFFLTIRLCIGIEGLDGGDDFELFVCTPTWIEKNVWVPLWGRHFLIIREFNYQSIVEFIANNIAQLDGKSWAEIGAKLARFFSWEFEDYQA